MNANTKTDSSQWNGRFSITLTLTTAIASLVLISTGSVLGVGIWLAQKNTFALLSDNANQSLSNTINRVEQHLLPARLQAEFIAKRVINGKVDPLDREKFGQLLVGALAAAPQVASIQYIDSSFQAQAASRDRSGFVLLENFDYSGDEQVRQRWEAMTDSPQWTAPLWRETWKKTFLNIGYPVKRNSEFVGVVVAVVSVREFSSFVRTVDATDKGTRFVLYGREHVLAHHILSQGYPGRSAEQPLPELTSFSDRILASIWNQQDRYELSIKLTQDTIGHALEIDNQEYVYLFRRLHGFGPKPLLIGAYFLVSDVGAEIRRMAIALVIGLGALLFAFVVAVILGRRIARPLVRFSNAASRVGKLDISNIDDLPGSVFRELNNQSISFNTMLRALRWFELYVPRKVVDRLIKRGELADTISKEQTITVMFTDMVGFSSISEGMTAPEVAAFVNQHFEIITKCIEAEEGTVDKFIGDSVMAFWGAPDFQPDADIRACRAALAIGEKIRSENNRLRSEGKPSIGIRIGIHTGTATVGNIGAPDRINYTVIGDTVNIGQRMEQLGKSLHSADSETTILVSGDTAKNLGSEFKLKNLGSHTIKGRTGSIEVFGLS